MIIRTASSLALTSAVLAKSNRKSHGNPGVSSFPGCKSSAGSLTKQQAIRDYQTSLASYGGRLSNCIDQLFQPLVRPVPWHYDVIVVGSGYGASICAARLSSKLHDGGRLAIFEQGREWVPGTFSDRFRGVAKDSRRSLLGRDRRTIRNPLGLINLVQGEDVSVLSASGLGGTSLINANVAICPDVEVFEQPAWGPYLNDRRALEPYFDLAAWELGVMREPVDLTPKMKAMRLAAERLRDQGAHFEASLLAVTRADQLGLPILNRHGMIQRPCTSCGDCMTGCNVGAKNTLAMNYLPMAKKHGAHIFTGIEVERIEKVNGFYQVHFIHYQPTEKGFTAVRGKTTSRIVILGAGSLGSTEILLRSQSSGLEFSSTLGQNWSGNGDILGYIRRTTIPTKTGGVGVKDVVRDFTGPTIQGNVTYPCRPNLRDRVIIQDGGSASAYNLFNSIFGRDIGLNNTQIILISGHDEGMGRIVMESDGRVGIRWPGMNKTPYRMHAQAELHRFAAALGGTYKELLSFKGQVGTVHPLGGCNLSSNPYLGVTNHKGQVYDLANGCDVCSSDEYDFRVHQGLYVVDGAIVPSPLGVNPMLTISALAERAADLLAAEPIYSDLFYQDQYSKGAG